MTKIGEQFPCGCIVVAVEVGDDGVERATIQGCGLHAMRAYYCHACGGLMQTNSGVCARCALEDKIHEPDY